MKSRGKIKPYFIVYIIINKSIVLIEPRGMTERIYREVMLKIYIYIYI